jgi:Flp pilus assembly protein TadG
MRVLTDFRRRRRYRNRPGRRNQGSAVIEMALIAPWFLFLFIGVVDIGFYCYDLIAVENAARVAAEYTSTGTDKADDAGGACTRVKLDLASLPNISGLAGPCDSLPLIVTATKGAGLGGNGTATTVTVTYQTQKLIPIPALLQGQFTFSSTAISRVKS